MYPFSGFPARAAAWAPGRGKKTRIASADLIYVSGGRECAQSAVTTDALPLALVTPLRRPGTPPSSPPTKI